MVKRRRRKKRGYPVAVLIGFNISNAFFWYVYSEKIKPGKIISLGGKKKRNEQGKVYNFHEEIIRELKPSLKAGVKSVVICSPPKTNYGNDFLEHVKNHHLWLSIKKHPNSAFFGELSGSATNLEEVTYLINGENAQKFKDIIKQTTTNEADNLIKTLEKRLNDQKSSNNIMYNLKNIEKVLYGTKKDTKKDSNNFGFDYILLTDQYLSKSGRKNRLHRLLQIAENYGIKTKIVDTETFAGAYLERLGGLVCF
ncbi:MAG: hypothetical protein ACTSWY_15055 [Promethearchaeota archaeon]